MTKKLVLFCCCFWMVLSCNQPYTPKKRGYFHIELPPRSYRVLQDSSLPYSFEYPVYAQVVQDSTYFDNNPENDYWRNIYFPAFNAKIFLSYKEIGGSALYKHKTDQGIYKDTFKINLFDKMVADAFTLTNKNDVVATSISDSLILTSSGISGVFFRVGGNAATAKQFFLTDSVRHFIRGALYFDVTPNVDSLRPVQDFLQKDLEHLINTFRWKKG